MKQDGSCGSSDDNGRARHGDITVSPLGGALISAGGEYGGIGGATRIWTWQLLAKMPF